MQYMAAVVRARNELVRVALQIHFPSQLGDRDYLGKHASQRGGVAWRKSARPAWSCVFSIKTTSTLAKESSWSQSYHSQ
jgi:hypothetical protein